MFEPGTQVVVSEYPGRTQGNIEGASTPSIIISDTAQSPLERLLSRPVVLCQAPPQHNLRN